MPGMLGQGTRIALAVTKPVARVAPHSRMWPGATHLGYGNSSRFARQPCEPEHPVDLEKSCTLTADCAPATSREPLNQDLPLPQGTWGWDALPSLLLVPLESKQKSCRVATSPCLPREASGDPHLAT